jgi:hypothetical protein
MVQHNTMQLLHVCIDSRLSRAPAHIHGPARPATWLPRVPGVFACLL